MSKTLYCGYVAIVGRPNVGKSTLLNHILGQKISITSHKPQTTRHQILGIKTVDTIQTIYVDTPGLHQGKQRAINRHMNRAATQALESVDVVGFVVEGLRWGEEEEWILSKLKKLTCPVILIVNKIDQIHPKTALLPHIAMLQEKMQFADIIPLSAKSGDNVAALELLLTKFLPEGPHFFPEDQVTDRTERFLASELIREKLTRYLHQELPYALTVEIEQFKTENEVLHISAIIWLERDTQKAIVIGKNGAQLKTIGTHARVALEKLFERKVFLKLWVKIKGSWSDDERALQSLGYNE